MSQEDETISQLANLCTSYFLMRHSSHLPIKRADLMKYVFVDNCGRKMVSQVMNLTKSTLKKVYGMNVIELNESTKSYILVNGIPENSFTPDWDSVEKQRQALLFLVLSVIFMNGGYITENSLWVFLRNCGLDVDGEDENFGDIKSTVRKDFYNQKYLKYEEVDKRDDEKIYSISWGPRAEHEVNRKALLQQVCQIYDCEITKFPEQCTQITEENDND